MKTFRELFPDEPEPRFGYLIVWEEPTEEEILAAKKLMKIKENKWLSSTKDNLI